MTNQESSSADRDALDPGELLRQIYLRKWILAGLTVLVGIAVAIFSKFISNSYEASSAIIPRAPEIPITGESAPQSIEVLRALADSVEVKGAVFRNLKERRVLDEGAEFAPFLKMLTVSVQEAAARREAPEPIIRLQAVSSSPETAAAIANAWADVVTSQTRAMYSSGIEDLNQFIGDLYEKAEERLAESEVAHVSKKAASSVEVKKAILARNNEVMSETHGELKQLQGQIAAKKGLLETARRRTSEEEFEGRWIGAVLYSRFKNNPSAQGSPAESSRVRRIASLIRNLIAAETYLAELRQKSGIQEKTIELKSAGALLDAVLRNQASAESDLAASQAKAQEAEKELASLPLTVSLNKAITDDALWNARFEGRALDAAIPALKTEEMNPAYQRVQGILLTSRSEARGSSETLSALKEKEARLRERIATLSGETSLIEAEIAFYASRIEADNALLKVMEDEFTRSRNEQEVLEGDLERALAEAAEKEKALGQLIRDGKALEEEIIRSEQEIASLGREVEKMRDVSNSLSSKAEEITLLKIAAERASRSGTAVLYRAHPNPQKVGPHRAKMVLGSMAACFFLLCLGIVLREIMREA